MLKIFQTSPKLTKKLYCDGLLCGLIFPPIALDGTLSEFSASLSDPEINFKNILYNRITIKHKAYLLSFH